MKKLRLIKSFTFVDVLLLIYVGYSMGGNTSPKHLYISVALLTTWLFFALVYDRCSFRSIIYDRKVVFLFLYLIYAFICGLINGPFVFELKQFVAGIYLFSPIFIFDYYSTKQSEMNQKKLKDILIFVLFIYLFYVFRALSFYGQNEAAARYLAMNKEKYGNIAIGGGYSLAYAAAILGVFLLSFIIEKRIDNSVEVILCLIIAVFSAVVVFRTQSTITLVCFVPSIIIAIIYKNKCTSGHRVKSVILSSVVAMGMVVLFVIFRKYVISFISFVASTQSGMFSIRINSIANFISGIQDNDSEYIINRFSIPFRSIKVFLNYLLTGVSYKHGNGYYNSTLYGIGQHGEWADALGNYGCIFGAVFILIYLRQIKEIEKLNIGLSPAWYICLLLLGLFNPFRSFNSHMIVFFVIPTISNLHKINKQKENGL